MLSGRVAVHVFFLVYLLGCTSAVKDVQKKASAVVDSQGASFHEDQARKSSKHTARIVRKAESAKPKVPQEGWRELKSDDGRVFYHNEETGETQWDAPVSSMISERNTAGADSIQEGWRELQSDDGRVFYHNEETGETQWDRPVAAMISERNKAGTDSIQDTWSELQSDDGQVFYHNEETGETQWDPPVASMISESSFKPGVVPVPIKGPDGPNGDTGPRGDTGARGAKGEKGETGKKGRKGPTGAIGKKGKAGEKGDAGAAPPSQALPAGLAQLRMLSGVVWLHIILCVVIYVVLKKKAEAAKKAPKAGADEFGGEAMPTEDLQEQPVK